MKVLIQSFQPSSLVQAESRQVVNPSPAAPFPRVTLDVTSAAFTQLTQPSNFTSQSRNFQKALDVQRFAPTEDTAEANRAAGLAALDHLLESGLEKALDAVDELSELTGLDPIDAFFALSEVLASDDGDY